MASVLLAASLLWLDVPPLQAQSNTVDPVFGGSSLGLANAVYAIALQPDGKLLVAGGTQNLVRLNPDGSTDTSFVTSLNTPPAAVAVQSDGGVIVAGSFTQANGTASSDIVHLNPDGSTAASLDPSVATNFAGVRFGMLVLQADGKILVSGELGEADGSFTPVLARLNADLTLDAGFNATFVGYGVPVVCVQSDGKIIVSGSFASASTFSQVNGVDLHSLARLNSDGSLDTTYTPVTTARAGPYACALLPGDQLLVQQAPFGNQSLQRLNKDGSVSETLGYQGYGYFTALEPNGQILVTESNGLGSGSGAFGLTRLNTDGSVDAGFKADLNNTADAVLPQTDGTVLIGGQFVVVSGVGCNSVVRLLADGSVDPGYRVDANSGPNLAVNSLALQSDGKVIVGGPFTAVNDVTHFGIARLKTDGTPDPSFNAQVTNQAQPDDGIFGNTDYVYSVAVQSDGKILLGGYFDTINGVGTGNVARLNPDGSLDTSFTGPYLELFQSMTLQPDGKILLFGTIEPDVPDGGYPYPLLRLNTDGSLDTGFNADYDGSYAQSALILQADGKIVVFTDGTLLRLNADGSSDPSFTSQSFNTADVHGNPNNDPYDCSLALQSDGKILLSADLYDVAGASSGLVRLNADGSLDTGFNATINVPATSIVAATDGTVVISGKFTQVDGQPRQGLAHLGGDGSLNPFIPTEIGTNGSISALLQQPDGKVLLGGKFTSVDGVQRNYVARLASGGTPDFFFGNVSVGNGFYYLQFPGRNPFGYYNLAGNGYAFPYFYHADLGMEYFYDANDGVGGAYMYDFASNTFFYTSPVFSWPYLYDFSLNSVLYYYPDPNNPGHYNTNGIRYFYNFATGKIISK